MSVLGHGVDYQLIIELWESKKVMVLVAGRVEAELRDIVVTSPE